MDILRKKVTTYTLIELIVTLAVIGILTTVLLQVLTLGREKMKDTNCINNLKAHGMGVNSYTQDNYGKLPYTDKWSCSSWKVLTGQYILTSNLGELSELKDLLLDKKVSSLKGRMKAIEGVALELKQDLYECDKSKDLGLLSLSDPSYGGYNYNTRIGELQGQGVLHEYKQTQITDPSETIVVADTQIHPNYMTDYYVLAPSNLGTQRYDKHNDGINSVWADLHVNWKSHDDIYTGGKPESSTKSNYYFDYKK